MYEWVMAVIGFGVFPLFDYVLYLEWPVWVGLLILLAAGVSAPILGALSENEKLEKKQIIDLSCNEKITKIKETLYISDGFKPTQKYNDEDSAILVDEGIEKICFIYNSLRSYSYLDFEDILDFEFVVDGNIVNRASTASLVGGVILGGMMAGQTGSLIGGLSAEQISEQFISSIVLKITVRHGSKTIHKITFFEVPSQVKIDNPECRAALARAERWQGVMNAICS